MFTVNRHVGRLLEVHIAAFVDPPEVEACAGAVRSSIAALKDKRPVICADYRNVTVFPPEVADKLVRIFADIDPRVERAAMLVPPKNAILALQVERIIRETRHPNRRSFQGVPELQLWLGEILEPSEKRRMSVFLSNPFSTPTPASVL